METPASRLATASSSSMRTERHLLRLGLLGIGLVCSLLSWGQNTSPMITEWTLTAPTTLTLPQKNATNVTIDWGDGTVETFTGLDPTHAYAAAGTYDVAVSCDASSPSDFGYFQVNNFSGAQLLTEVKQWGTGEWSSFHAAFYNAQQCEFTAADAPIFAATASNFNQAFRNAYGLADVDFSAWEVGHVTDMSHMFYQATAFNGDLSTWNVENVTNMGNMFDQAYAFNSPIGSWNTLSLTSMQGMFQNAHAFNQDINGWEVSGVTTVVNLFNNARAFNQPIGGWNMLGKTDLSNMFNNAVAFNQDLSGWEVNNVTAFTSMFQNAQAFNQPIGSWDMSAATTLQSMFRGASAFNQPLAGWDVSHVTNFNATFMTASSFNQPLSAWEMGAATDLANCFKEASAFNQDLGTWNTPNLTSMVSLFESASAFNGALTLLDVSGVSNFSNVFRGAASFNQPLAQWDMSNATNLAYMFYYASSFNQSVDSWDVSNVTDLQGTFFNAPSFNQPLNSWNVSNVTNMSSLFKNDIAFNQPLGAWDVSNVTQFTDFLHGAQSFDQDLSAWPINPAAYSRNFMTNVQLSVHHYDALLLNWAERLTGDFQLNSSSKHSNIPVVVDARATLVSNITNLSDAGSVEEVVDVRFVTPFGGTTLDAGQTVDRYGNLAQSTALTTAGKSTAANAGSAPIVNTLAADNLAADAADLHGIVGSHGGQSITSQGFVLNTAGTPTTADTVVSTSTGMGTFSASASGLTGGTTYFVRAFATNAIGTQYGPEVSFTTL